MPRGSRLRSSSKPGRGRRTCCPERVEKPGIEDCWSLIKKGVLRLYDDDIDDDTDVILREAVTPGQQQRARHVGARLFAVRQHIKRQGREAARRR
jgi:hypothetical protein